MGDVGNKLRTALNEIGTRTLEIIMRSGAAKDFEPTIESGTIWRFIASVNQVTHKIPIASTTLPRMAHGKGGKHFRIAPANLRL